MYVPLIEPVPCAPAVTVIEQLPLTSVQLGGPERPPPYVNATVPAGVVLPAPLESATVTWHENVVPVPAEAGHANDVEVLRRAPVTDPLVAPLLALPAWTLSLAV